VVRKKTSPFFVVLQFVQTLTSFYNIGPYTEFICHTTIIDLPVSPTYCCYTTWV